MRYLLLLVDLSWALYPVSCNMAMEFHVPALGLLLLVLAGWSLLLAGPSAVECSLITRHRGQEGPDHEMRFEPTEPERLFESSGGSIMKWKDPMMTHMGLMDARKVTLNEQSLLLPQYANSNRLLVILRGCARMGLVLPMGMKANVRQVRKGEMIAIPRGMPFWMYNDGKEPCCFLNVANIRSPMMHGGHMYETFHVSGASEQQMGGIMHGFSPDMLAAALDMDEESVRELTKGQDGVAMVRLAEHMQRFQHHDEKMEQGGAVMADFSYNLEEAHRDVVHPRAGQLTIANGYKLPVLKLMGMSVGCLRLEPEAMTAPGWFSNADHMIYCVRGSARVQVVRPDGSQACDVEMREGTMMMVPKNYPCMKKAGGDGFKAAIIMNCHRPMAMHMTGKDSIFSIMPREVRMASFGIDRELDGELHEQSSRRHSTFLLPPCRRNPPRLDQENEESFSADHDAFSSLEEMRAAIWSMFDDSSRMLDDFSHLYRVVQ